MKLLGNVMTPGAQWHIFCSDLLLYHQSRSFCAAMKKKKDVKGDLGGKGKKGI